MRSRDRRLVFDVAPAPAAPKLGKAPAAKASGDSRLSLVKNPDMTWHDHLVMLLHIGAEIEHGLMVQYLYAAYSIGGDHIPERHRPMVDRWRTSIVAVAKEEMGHLLTVQNILMLLGASINLDRQDFPWDIQYYPFPFRLEPFTMSSLSAYVFAEMPQGGKLVMPNKKPLSPRYRQFEQHDLARIEASVKARVRTGTGHAVATIYNEIIELLKDERRIPDSAFEDESYGAQASWDDWGRGYKPDPRMLDAQGNLMKGGAKPAASQREANVLIDRVATRTEAIAALQALAGQGEAPHLGADDSGEPSHFDRFLEIYQDFEKVESEGWSASRPVAVNPTTLDPGNASDDENTYIASDHSRDWAALFNLRYRMLLTYLSHTFRLARSTRNDAPNVRAMMMHRVFGEMYNLKAMADILVRLPLGGDGSQGAARAGAPFEMPYTLSLPPSPADAWRLHRDLLGSADHRAHALLASADRTGHPYLKTLIGIDAQTRAWLDSIIGGLDPVHEAQAAAARGRGTTHARGNARSPS